MRHTIKRDPGLIRFWGAFSFFRDDTDKYIREKEKARVMGCARVLRRGTLNVKGGEKTSDANEFHFIEYTII